MRSSTARAARIRTGDLVAAQDTGRGTLLRIDIDMPQCMEVAWKTQKLVVSKASERRRDLDNFGLLSVASIPEAELIISFPACLKVGLSGILSHSAGLRKTANGHPFPIRKASHIIGDVSRFRALTEETEKREYRGQRGFRGLDRLGP
jgi:hypothetical protein